MKKYQDITTILSIILFIIFLICTAIYILKNKNVNFNEGPINSNIYHEHTIEQDNLENTENVQKTYVEIASYTTKIYDTDKNRIYNIKRASEKLDGHIVKPQEEFSFNKTLGAMNAHDGYKKAIGFDSNGNKIKMYGGGICQISSTLYNAVLASKLKVTERHAHSRRVNYVPKDKDATVYSGGPDFRFINTSTSNIMICSYTDGYAVTVSLKEEQKM